MENHITLAELLKYPKGTLFQMTAADTELNDYSECSYPADLACLCVKSETLTEDSFLYNVVIPLDGRIALNGPDLENYFTLKSPEAESAQTRKNIKLWNIADLDRLGRIVRQASLIALMAPGEERVYHNVWTKANEQKT